MKRIFRICLAVVLLGLACSCGPQPESGLPSGTDAHTAAESTPSLTASFPVPTTTAAPVPRGTITPTVHPEYRPDTSQPDQQTYFDPAGWYAVNIPADWSPGEAPGSFAGPDGFLETGSLPEYAYQERALQVCQWLANVEFPGAYQVSWLSEITGGCQLISLPGVTPERIIDVVPNFAADPFHRYLYLTSDPDHHPRIAASFSWLRPVEGVPGQPLPFRPEDRAFWDSTKPLPEGLTITEYPLPREGQGISPAEAILLEYVPEEALPKVERSGGVYQAPTMESINEILDPFGYRLQIGAESYLYDLYREGELEISNINRLPEIYLDDSGEQDQIAFLAYSVKDPEEPYYKSENAATYLVQEDSIRLWGGPPNPMLRWGRGQWVDGELLLLGLGEQTDLQVRSEDYQLVYTFQTYFSAHIPIRQFTSWEDHWILGVSDFLIEDGEVLNQKYSVEAVYSWRILDGKPFHFFQKGPRSGLMYDGQFLAVSYDEIAHGYCCGLALNNPMFYENSVRFFGQREGVWYYVVLEVE